MSVRRFVECWGWELPFAARFSRPRAKTGAGLQQLPSAFFVLRRFGCGLLALSNDCRIPAARSRWLQPFTKLQTQKNLITTHDGIAFTDRELDVYVANYRHKTDKRASNCEYSIDRVTHKPPPTCFDVLLLEYGYLLESRLRLQNKTCRRDRQSIQQLIDPNSGYDYWKQKSTNRQYRLPSQLGHVVKNNSAILEIKSKVINVPSLVRTVNKLVKSPSYN